MKKQFKNGSTVTKRHMKRDERPKVGRKNQRQEQTRKTGMTEKPRKKAENGNHLVTLRRDMHKY